jgi:endonuclease III
VKSAAITRRIIETLAKQHPNADTELHYRNAFELLVATMLSAQSTDARVNLVTPALFKRYPDARALARATTAELEPQILSTGFFRQKSKSLVGMATQLVEEHKGEVPADMELLTKLPGVGRKTANVVLGACARRARVARRSSRAARWRTGSASHPATTRSKSRRSCREAATQDVDARVRRADSARPADLPTEAALRALRRPKDCDYYRTVILSHDTRRVRTPRR